MLPRSIHKLNSTLGASRNHVASKGEGGGPPKAHESLRGGIREGDLPKGYVAKIIENLSNFPFTYLLKIVTQKFYDGIYLLLTQ